MTDTIHNTILPMTDTTAEPEDYTGEDGLLYCGKCRKPKEAYFPEGKTFFGRDRHPKECDCQRKRRETLEANHREQKHREEVERLKRRGFTNPAMQSWTFENDNGKCPQMKYALKSHRTDENGTSKNAAEQKGEPPMKEVPIWEKSNLSLEEAAAYSGIGINKLRDLTNDKNCRMFYG